MAQPLVVGMTPEIIVESNFVVRFVALDPSDGSDVSGVVFSSGAILATDLSDNTAGTTADLPSPVTGAYTSGSELV